MDLLHERKTSCYVDEMMEDRDSSSQPSNQYSHVWCKQKQAEVHEEVKRMSQLPTQSNYVTHRLRVLNKILQLMSIQRDASQDRELELLFAGLSL